VYPGKGKALSMRTLTKLAVASACHVLLLTQANAVEKVAHCRLVADGQEVWNGKCCVSFDLEPGETGASLHASGWQACLYDRKHPEQANLPGFQQTCYGPWINIWPEDGAYLAYWSLDNACHAGFPPVSARRAGQVYQGDNFIFDWR
jgi:hypothetical protein